MLQWYCVFSGAGDEANKIPTFSPYYLIHLSGWILSHYFLMLKQNELMEIFLVKHLIRVSTTHREVSMGKGVSLFATQKFFW